LGPQLKSTSAFNALIQLLCRFVRHPVGKSDRYAKYIRVVKGYRLIVRRTSYYWQLIPLQNPKSMSMGTFAMRRVSAARMTDAVHRQPKRTWRTKCGTVYVCLGPPFGSLSFAPYNDHIEPQTTTFHGCNILTVLPRLRSRH
jgi:hypothetical protein